MNRKVEQYLQVSTMREEKPRQQAINDQAVRAIGTNLTRAQRRRERHQQLEQQRADRRAQHQSHKPVTVGDVAGPVALGIIAVIALAALAGWVLRIDSWPALWGAA